MFKTRKSRRNAKIIAAIAIATFAVAFLANIQSFATITYQKTIPGSSFVPAQIKNPRFTVRGEYGGPVIGESINGYWADPTHQYPAVSMYYGQPYVADAAGNPIQRNDLPSRMLYSTEDGSVWYLHQYFIAFNGGVRTKSNKPSVMPSTAAMLNPFSNQQYSVSGILGQSFGGAFKLDLYSAYPGKTGTPQQPTQNLGLGTGVLALYVDATNPMSSLGVTMTQAGGAQITQSLVPINFNSLLSGGDPAQSATNALAALPGLYGLGKVYVDLQFDLVGMSNYITYTYTQNAEIAGENVQFVMTQSSGLVGFERAYCPAGSQYENVIPNNVTGIYGNATGSIVDRESDDTRNPAANNIPYTTQHTAMGSLEYQPWLNPPDQLIALTADFPEMIGTSLDNATVPQIRLDEIADGIMTIPENVSVTAPCVMQPAVREKTACVLVKWQSAIGCPASTSHSIYAESQMQRNLFYPYAVSWQNVAAAGTFVFQMDVINQCNMSANYISGAPYDYSTLTDFELNEIVMHPDWDNVKLRVDGYTFDVMEWLGDILTWIIVIALIIGAIILIWFLDRLGVLKAIKRLFRRR